jgi:hypothetical protein
MHRCLSISEILSYLLDNFCRDPELAAVARTCKEFTGQFSLFRSVSAKSGLRDVAEPALDLLWRDQVSLAPLIRCMPQDLWVMKICEAETGRDPQTVTISFGRESEPERVLVSTFRLNQKIEFKRQISPGLR